MFGEPQNVIERAVVMAAGRGTDRQSVIHQRCLAKSSTAVAGSAVHEPTISPHSQRNFVQQGIVSAGPGEENLLREKIVNRIEKELIARFFQLCDNIQTSRPSAWASTETLCIKSSKEYGLESGDRRINVEHKSSLTPSHAIERIMRLVYFKIVPVEANRCRSATVKSSIWLDVDASIPTSMRELLACGPSMMSAVQKAAVSGKSIPTSSVKLLAPILDPQRFLALGSITPITLVRLERDSERANYFCKLPTAVRVNRDPIVIPRLTSKVDYEAELVVVIGKQGRNIRKSRPRNTSPVIAAEMMFLGVIGRRKNLAGNGCLVIARTASHPSVRNLSRQTKPARSATCEFNAHRWQTMQDSSTSQLIFDIHISSITSLAA